MTRPPAISVIIPAYNAEPFISHAIDSVLAQTIPAQEILVIDDGSQDATAEVVSRYPPPVRLIRQANGGPASARNQGARVATGEWLALLDADDVWLPHKLEQQIPYTERKEVGMIHSPAVQSCTADLSPVTFERLWSRNRIGNSSVLIRRAAFMELGGFDEDRALISVEDYNLWLRLTGANWEIATCPEPLWRYSPAPGSLASQVERFALAELVNLEKISRQFRLDPGKVKKKKIAILEQYGRFCLHERQRLPARRFLFATLREQPSPSRLLFWLATFAPAALLNLRR